MAKAARRTFKSPTEKGITFLNKAAENYLSARILYLHNQLFDAGVLAHEALEKVMKAILFLRNPLIPLGNEHDLLNLKDYIESELNLDLSDQEGALAYYQDCYNYRYPDNQSPGSFSTGTPWFNYLDAFFMYYHDICIANLPDELDKRRTGIYENCLSYFQNNREVEIRDLTHENKVVSKEMIDATCQWWKDNGYLTYDKNGVMKLPSGGTYQDLSKAVKE